MCNLYSHTRNVEAMRKLFARFDVAAQVVPQPGIFSDYSAPIIRNEGSAPMLAMTRWGMPSSSTETTLPHRAQGLGNQTIKNSDFSCAWRDGGRREITIGRSSGMPSSSILMTQRHYVCVNHLALAS